MGDKARKFRSNCPVNFGLETFGDKWSLLIIRDMIFWGKRTYGEFLRSDEGIATNILASRLLQLEENGILQKTPHSSDKRTDVYSLTEKGMALIPLMVEIVAWSGNLSQWQSISGAGTPEQIRQVKRFAAAKDKRKIIAEIREALESGSYFFAPRQAVG
jgi:DNA-binding HxlR family transcriptional regulator